jgi:hypothetical protein
MIMEMWKERCLRVTDWFLTDAALQQLKEQAAEGCLLCLLDAFDTEDWE